MSGHVSACLGTCPHVWTADVPLVVSEAAEDTGDGAAPPEPPPATALHHSWGMVMVRPSFRVSAIPYTIHLHCTTEPTPGFQCK